MVTRIRILNVATREQVAELPHEFLCTGLAFSPDGARLVTSTPNFLTLWDVRRLPVELKAELERERERLVLVERQIEQLEATRRERLQNPRSEAERRVVHLLRLGAIGPTSAWLLP